MTKNAKPAAANEPDPSPFTPAPQRASARSRWADVLVYDGDTGELLTYYDGQPFDGSAFTVVDAIDGDTGEPVLMLRSGLRPRAEAA
jgi:hypothetical protein